MSIRSLTIYLGILILVVFGGCDLLNSDTPPPPKSVSGNDLVVTEVFSISPEKFYSYSWFEVYNPTGRKLKWFDETFPAYGLFAGTGGAVGQTTSDGTDWTGVSLGGDFNFNDYAISNPDTAVMVGNNGLVKIVTNLRGLRGPVTYQDPTSNPITANLRAIASLSPARSTITTPTLFVVGDTGTAYRSTSNGRNFPTTKIRTNTRRNLNDVQMRTVADVIAVGDSGTIVQSANPNWNVRAVPLAFQNTNFYTVAFNKDTGVVGGADGVVLRSVSNSANPGFLQWEQVPSGTSNTLRGSFMDERFKTGWLVGDNGTILSTSNSGRTWNTHLTGFSENFRAVCFVDSMRGWITGDNGIILVTTNGGTTWQLQQSGTNGSIRSIDFLPLVVRVLDRYVLEVKRGIRKYFYFNPLAGQPTPGVNPNFDYIVFQDTGSVFIDGEVIRDFGAQIPDNFKAAIGFPEVPTDVEINQFLIFNNDSLKFREHTDIGPGRTKVYNYSLAFTDTTQFGAIPILWDLLPSSEIRLYRVFRREFILAPFNVIGTPTSKFVDVVRFGNFVPDPSDPTNPDFSSNFPAEFIPDWSSLARYSDDFGKTDIRQVNTRESFYISSEPLPGWHSLRSR